MEGKTTKRWRKSLVNNNNNNNNNNNKDSIKEKEWRWVRRCRKRKYIEGKEEKQMDGLTMLHLLRFDNGTTFDHNEFSHINSLQCEYFYRVGFLIQWLDSIVQVGVFFPQILAQFFFQSFSFHFFFLPWKNPP